MVVAGVPEELEDHTDEIGKLALSMMTKTSEIPSFTNGYKCQIRIGN